MIKVALVGCTGKLGGMIAKTIYSHTDYELKYAIGRKGNSYIGKDISVILGGQTRGVPIIDNINDANDCDVFIDCTNSKTFILNNLPKYLSANKPVLIATTGFSEDDLSKIKALSMNVPVMISGNYSIALYYFIESLKPAAKRISIDTDVQIVEFHHNEKKDAPSGTAIMIQNALISVNPRLNKDNVNICSVRGGNIFGQHQVIFANCRDEIIEYKHKVSSREAFSSGAIEVAKWLTKQKTGYYTMDDFCFSDSHLNYV